MDKADSDSTLAERSFGFGQGIAKAQQKWKSPKGDLKNGKQRSLNIFSSAMVFSGDGFLETLGVKIF